MQTLISIIYKDKDKRHNFVITYAASTVSRILMLLHYLAVIWIWLGSISFENYEEGRLPWQMANDDFAGNSKYQIYVFSVYWVCTVVTTVGYGDYYGQTTIELQYTIFLEFFGLVVFTVLQVAVLQVVNHDTTFDSFIM